MNQDARHIAIARIDTGDIVYTGEYDPVPDADGWAAAKLLKPGTCYAKADTAAQAISFARHEAEKFRTLLLNTELLKH